MYLILGAFALHEGTFKSPNVGAFVGALVGPPVGLTVGSVVGSVVG